MRGTAFVFGDNINTDYITPSDYFGRPIDEIADHLFEPIDDTFTNRVTAGDIVVAGDNFGCGSSRETAPQALQAAGVSAVVAESFARLFYRNAIAIGLPVAICSGATDMVTEGDTVDVDVTHDRVTNVTTGETRSCEPLPVEIEEIFEAGGLLEHYRAKNSLDES